MSKKNTDATILWKDRKRIVFGLPWSFTKYSLSEERLFIQRGFFNVREDEVRLYRIMDISLTRTLGQRLFGIGTINFCSADKTLKDFQFKNIKKSRDVKELISELVEKERTAKRVSSREFMSDDHDETLDEDNDDFDNNDL